MVLDALLDAVIDTAKLLPFLFLTYLFMEWLERRTEARSAEGLRRVGRFGPLFGGVVGVVPQCGFSAAAASLFSGGVITVGSMIAVFLSTSDEMLPIFLSEAVRAGVIGKILLTKVLIAVATGFLVDFLLRLIRRKAPSEKHIHDLCEQDHCGCEEDEEGGILLPALRHTLQITLFIFIISFVIGLLVEGLGTHVITRYLTERRVLGTFLAGLIGLIPNCAASVMITELFLAGILTSGQMLAGLLVGAGVGLLVLFRTNRHHLREDLQVTAFLFVCGLLWGLLIDGIGIQFL